MLCGSPSMLKDTCAILDEKGFEESRKKVLESADYIIPGHGLMYKVEK